MSTNVDISGGAGDDPTSSARVELDKKLNEWAEELKDAVQIVSEPSPQKEPYKNTYAGILIAETVRDDIQKYAQINPQTKPSPLTKLTLIHVYSSLAKWHESCDELSTAEEEHKLCIGMIEQFLSTDASAIEPGMEEHHLEVSIRCRFMLTYELTRYAILCSERDNQEKALELLKKAEEIYHKGKEKESLPPEVQDSILAKLDSLNSQCSKDLFTYVLFYLGQAYRITGEKEKAVLYLHMVLRRQLEEGDYSSITWSADTARMASVVMINLQAYETARNILLAATVVLQNTPEEEKSGEPFRECWADLGRCWVKLGVELLEASSDRLKDLGEQTRKPVKFCDVIKFTPYEKMSLEISDPDQEEFDTLLLIKSLQFPTLDVASVQEVEMRGRYVRDYDEARAVFLPLQRWVSAARNYYIIDEHASDYIDIMTDYSNSFKFLAFFEPNLDRQVKMHRRRIVILEDLLKQLNPKAFADVFIHCLKELAEIYEKVYSLKVAKSREKGESLHPKSAKLAKILMEAVGAHKRNLGVFDFNINDRTKNFPPDYEKTLLGSTLSIGRILGSVSHDHPLHPEAIDYAEEGKLFYKFFLEYVERRPKLMEELKVLYEGSKELPDLLDTQIERIKHRLRGLTLS